MRRLITIFLLITTAFITVNAQNKLSGSLGPYANNNSWNKYTDLNWEVTYQFEKKKNGIYLKYLNPKVTVAHNSLYSTAAKNYSKSELGLSAWPEIYLPSSLNVSVDCHLPNGEVVLSGFAVSSFNYNPYEKRICGTTLNGKELDPSDFRLSVTKAYYNPQSIKELDDIIRAKQAQNSNTNTSKSATTNTTQNHSNNNNPATNNPLSSSQTNNSSNNNPLNTKTDPPTYELRYSDIGLPEAYQNGSVNNGNPMLNNNSNYSPSPGNYSNDNTVQAVGAVVDLISAWGNQAEAERERKKAAERQMAEEKKQREAEAAAVKSRKLQLAAERKALLGKLPDGNTPLSHEARAVSEVYFFVYSYNKNTLEDSSPLISISNVFSIQKYSDGTWPFKASLMEGISKMNKTPGLILSGYYSGKEKAEEQQQLFVKATTNYGFKVENILYEGKKTSQTNSNTDYWGNPIKNEALNEAPKTNQNKPTTPTIKKVDFWGNPINN